MTSRTTPVSELEITLFNNAGAALPTISIPTPAGSNVSTGTVLRAPMASISAPRAAPVKSPWRRSVRRTKANLSWVPKPKASISTWLVRPPRVPTFSNSTPSRLISTRTDSTAPVSNTTKSGLESPLPVRRLLVNWTVIDPPKPSETVESPSTGSAPRPLKSGAPRARAEFWKTPVGAAPPRSGE